MKENERMKEEERKIAERRAKKLARLTPTLRVRAFSDEDGDLKAAKLATGVLNYVQDKIGFSGIVARANLWSETCGSVFYKVTWDEKGGRQVAVTVTLTGERGRQETRVSLAGGVGEGRLALKGKLFDVEIGLNDGARVDGVTFLFEEVRV